MDFEQLLMIFEREELGSPRLEATPTLESRSVSQGGPHQEYNLI